jgi:hypothetical protein
MSMRQRLDRPAAGSGVMTRLRLWSHLWHRYASGDHLDVSGADALRARAALAAQRGADAGPGTA